MTTFADHRSGIVRFRLRRLMTVTALVVGTVFTTTVGAPGAGVPSVSAANTVVPDEAEPVQVSLASVPSAPTISAIWGRDTALEVHFTPPATGAGITHYEYTFNAGNTTASAGTTSSPIVITGLTNGTNYNVQIRAVNGSGAGDWSNSRMGMPRLPAITIQPQGPAGNPRTVTLNSPMPAGGPGGATIGFVSTGFSDAVTFSASTVLPTGVTLQDDGTSATLVGTPTQSGTFTFTVIAAEGALTASSPSFTLTVTGGQQQSTPVVLPPLIAEPVPSTTTTPSTTVAPSTTAPLLVAPGSGRVLVDGVPVATEVVSVSVPAASVAPDERTPEQVADVQQAAEALLDTFNEAAPQGVEPLVTLTNTDTGAVLNGVLVDPRDGATNIPVPVEDVVLVSAADTRVLLAGASPDGTPENVANGVLQISESGAVSALAYGLPEGVAGEVVIFSTPTLLGTFTTGDDGSFAGQVDLPTDLAPGAHTIVLTAGGVTTSLGLMVADTTTPTEPATPDTTVPSPAPTELPSTGENLTMLVVIMAALLTAAGVLLITRRRVA